MFLTLNEKIFKRKHDIRTVIRTATFSKGKVAQELRRDSSCATLPFAVLVLRYPLYSSLTASLSLSLALSLHLRTRTNFFKNLVWNILIAAVCFTCIILVNLLVYPSQLFQLIPITRQIVLRTVTWGKNKA